MGTSIAEFFGRLGLIPNESEWARGDKLISGMKTALAGLATYETLKGIGELVMGTIDLGGHLDDLRQKTGLSAEVLQEYGYAAKLGGSDMDSFAGGVGKFARTLQEAKDGSEQAETALQRVGLTSKDVAGALHDGDGLDRALLKISDRFKSMPDGPAKTALAMSLFGKSGAELIPTLNLGRDGLAELRTEAQNLGVVMGDKAVTSTDALGDNIDKLKMSVIGLKNQAISALAPVLNDIVQRTLTWIKANQEVIKSTIAEWAPRVASAIQSIAVAVGEVIGWLGAHWNGVVTTAGAILGAFAIDGVAAFFAFLSPIALAAGAVLALGDDITDVWGDLKDLWHDVERLPGIRLLTGATDEEPDANATEAPKQRAYSLSDVAGGIGSVGDLQSQSWLHTPHAMSSTPSTIVPGSSGPAGGSAAAASMNTSISAPITINGAQDPQAVGAAVKEHLSGVMSGAYQALRGGKR